ncbi:MAG: 30S ribosomal protein S7 [Ardenticatenales bacterium]|jgi:small subunit ribosomal protein S7|nr:30S ribosomal protein S7 [Ardenticatenales bacterium]MCC7018859.1 30S ribosomal protein S7 [Ardenticatenales bacterium]
MPRRTRPPKRETPPDARYDNRLVGAFINRLMVGGKKSTAERIMYDAFDTIEQRLKRPAVEVFEQAMRNVMPLVEVKPRRVGGSTYQVPVEVRPDRRVALGMRWIIGVSRKRSGKGMSSKLAGELMDAANGQGATVRKREETHRMADANKAFAHYRW